MPDAVVIGAGQNGLVAANLLADEGWDVLVLEAEPDPGGAVRSGQLTVPGFVHDRFSAFYPLAVGSPVMRALHLEEHGLRWCRSPLVLAHPLPDGRCAALSTDLDETAASLDAFAPGDGDAWRRLFSLWRRVREPLLDALLLPFPPVGPAARLVGRLRASELLRFVRFLLLPVRRMAEEEFQGEGGGLLLAGNAMHTDLPPEGPLSGLFGWLLCSLGQEVGFPVPEGGAGNLTAALVRRLESRGGRVRCGTRVTRVVVRAGRAVAVRTESGDEIPARRAVLADVGAPALYRELLQREHVPTAVLDDLRRFQYDNPTVKVDWALDAPVPWTAEPARRAGTVHVADGMDQFTEVTCDLTTRRVPRKPFLIVGQMNVADPSRSPAGTSTVWAYTHVPHGTLRERAEVEAFADVMEGQLERLAPGFGALVRGRHAAGPCELEASNANLVDGAVNGGTSALYQQLVFRPLPGRGTAATPVDGLYLASASAHPGGGVHGACGGNAAAAALGRGRPWRALRARLS